MVQLFLVGILKWELFERVIWDGVSVKDFLNGGGVMIIFCLIVIRGRGKRACWWSLM